jgi:hypothetical protein
MIVLMGGLKRAMSMPAKRELTEREFTIVARRPIHWRARSIDLGKRLIKAFLP